MSNLKDTDNEQELCRVGDKLYKILKDNVVLELDVIDIKHYPHSVYFTKDSKGYATSCFNRAFGRNIFKTKEDAEAMLRKKQLIIKKRELLRDYETKLNEGLGLGDHSLIK